MHSSRPLQHQHQNRNHHPVCSCVTSSSPPKTPLLKLCLCLSMRLLYTLTWVCLFCGMWYWISLSLISAYFPHKIRFLFAPLVKHYEYYIISAAALNIPLTPSTLFHLCKKNLLHWFSYCFSFCCCCCCWRWYQFQCPSTTTPLYLLFIYLNNIPQSSSSLHQHFSKILCSIHPNPHATTTTTILSCLSFFLSFYPFPMHVF